MSATQIRKAKRSESMADQGEASADGTVQAIGVSTSSKPNTPLAPRWSHDNARKDIVGTFLRNVPELDTYENLAFTNDPCNHKLPQSSVMLRECTLSVIKDSMKELEGGVSRKKIVLGNILGSTGSYIVSDASLWVSGREFYRKNNSGQFTQSELVAKVLAAFGEVNGKILKEAWTFY
ncbi:hypothetical protein HDU96_000269 [Phlyctochytrium bullatum]|nr:hypothetical protein HDU96_000269 [Phlyctochytrium bullatum]